MRFLRYCSFLLASSSFDPSHAKTPRQAMSDKLPKINGKTTVASTRWLQLETIDYTDQEGKDRKWDVATRTTKQASSAADAVVIIPL